MLCKSGVWRDTCTLDKKLDPSTHSFIMPQKCHKKKIMFFNWDKTEWILEHNIFPIPIEIQNCCFSKPFKGNSLNAWFVLIIITTCIWMEKGCNPDQVPSSSESSSNCPVSTWWSTLSLDTGWTWMSYGRHKWSSTT